MRGEINDWRLYLRASGKPHTTIKLRTYQLHRWTETHHDPLHATPGELTTWLAQPGWSPATRKSFRAALRSFYTWAHATGLIDQDPTRLLPPVRCPAAPARPAPETAVASALLAAGPREQLMVTLAARHGLRRGEIARVHTDDLVEDLVGWSLRVHGKGRKDRVVPVSETVANSIREAQAGWLFPSPYGGHLTEQHVGKLIARVLPGQWTAHTLRHRFATVAYAGTHDLLAVQEFLGHSRPETTRGYIQLPQESLRAALQAAA